MDGPGQTPETRAKYKRLSRRWPTLSELTTALKEPQVLSVSYTPEQETHPLEHKNAPQEGAYWQIGPRLIRIPTRFEDTSQKALLEHRELDQIYELDIQGSEYTFMYAHKTLFGMRLLTLAERLGNIKERLEEERDSVERRISYRETL